MERPLIELTEAHHALAARARAFALEKIRPFEHDESDAFALRITREMGEAGLLDAGVALDVRGIALAREAVAHASGLADSMLALQGLGHGPIALAGTSEQRARWTEEVRAGRAIAAIAITEPEAGSDLAGIRATARRDGDSWILDGRKCFITNAGIADLYVGVFRTSEDRTRGLTAICFGKDAVAFTERYELVAPHPAGEIALNGARVPYGNLVGAEGEGMKLALETLERFRTTVGAAAVGMAQRALDEALSWARTRVQFGKPIGTYQQIQAMLADSWAELEAARLMVYRSATARDRHDADAPMWASASKMLATETAQRVIDRAVQIHGGQGVRRGSAVERLYREIRALRIYEGTTEIQRVVLSRALLGKI